MGCRNCYSSDGRVSILGEGWCTECDGTKRGRSPFCDIVETLQEHGVAAAKQKVLEMRPDADAEQVINQVQVLLLESSEDLVYKHFTIRRGRYMDWWVDDPRGKRVQWAQTLEEAKIIVDHHAKSV